MAQLRVISAYFFLVGSIFISSSLFSKESVTVGPPKKEMTLKKFSKAHLIPALTDGFDTKGVTILGTGALLSLIAHQYDDKVKSYFNKKNRLGSTLTDFGNSFGASYVNIFVAGMQMIWDRSNGMAHFEALAGSTLMTFSMKKSIHRTRPNGENEDSFPSGHTSTAFASSGSLSYAYGMKAAILSYSLTSLTFLARMQDNKHLLSDVIMATAIGVYWSRSSGIHHHYLAPIILKDGGGVEFKYGF